MIYYFRYVQGCPDEKAYRALVAALDSVGFTHEMAPGKLLVAPSCHIYSLRLALDRYVRGGDTLSIVPVTENDFADEATRQFVRFWLHPSRDFTRMDLIARFSG